MNTTATKTDKLAKAIRIAITTILAACGLVCLYAVLFMHRPDHLLITAAYAAMIWTVNHKDEQSK